MRFPPLLTPNNLVRVTDEANAAAFGGSARFAPFTLSCSVIGPWLTASFDEPAFPTGQPIGRLTLLGPFASFIRTAMDDGSGCVLTLASGAGRQPWEVVSSVEWTASGDSSPVWVFCFCRPFRPGVLVGGGSCPTAPEAPFETRFRMSGGPATQTYGTISGLPAGNYVARYNLAAENTGASWFYAYPGNCTGLIDPGAYPVSGVRPVTIAAGQPMRLFFSSISGTNSVYVEVEPA